MLSIGEIAAREGVKKPGVSRRVKRLRDSGLQVELDDQGRVARVNFAQYEELKHRFGDPSKAQLPARPPAAPPEGQNESYDEARRVLTWTEAERAKLRLEAEQKLYVKTEDLEGALIHVGESIVRSADRLIQSADDLAAAVAREGAGGLRAELKKLVHRLKTEIADELAGVIPS